MITPGMHCGIYDPPVRASDQLGHAIAPIPVACRIDIRILHGINALLPGPDDVRLRIVPYMNDLPGKTLFLQHGAIQFPAVLATPVLA